MRGIDFISPGGVGGGTVAVVSVGVKGIVAVGGAVSIAAVWPATGSAAGSTLRVNAQMTSAATRIVPAAITMIALFDELAFGSSCLGFAIVR